MSRWRPTVALDADDERPLRIQIADRLQSDIRRGRLTPGASLPGSRQLAETLGVHRNTVIAAYEELIAQGWLQTRPGSGTFVSEALPEIAPRPSAAPTLGELPIEPAYDLPPMEEAPEVHPAGVLSLDSLPDPQSLPSVPLMRAIRRALRLYGRTLLDYADPQGDPHLRVALAEVLATARGLIPDPQRLVITRGSQMALWLAAQALIRPGDRVAVEALGYRPAWVALQAAGAELVPVPVDEEGLRVDALSAIEGPLKAVYLTPHHQYPTTVPLSPRRRLALLEMARRRRIALLEDDYDNEFHYEGRPLMPLASAAPEVVIYIGTLSKVLAPGLRIGYACAPARVIERMITLRRAIDRQGDALGERAVAELFEEGEVQRHIRRMRRTYMDRRDTLTEALKLHLGGAVKCDRPAGGMALWVDVDPEIDIDLWVSRCRDLGVTFSAGGRYTFDGTPLNALRLGFARLPPEDLRRAVQLMVQALPR
ncbi:MAG: PLP-dependent aminotransferase family protein [Bradymonadia bacterium]